MSRVFGRCLRATALLLSTAGFAACSDTAAPRTSQEAALAVASGAGGKAASVTVTTASPSFGRPGQANEVDTIIGSGFNAGAQAAYLLNGVADPTITVVSTQVVSSTQLVSVINIAPTAPIAFRDIQVANKDRTQGTGYSLFEVTQAIPVAGAGVLRGVNDNGEITGNVGPLYWSSASGLLPVANDNNAGFAMSAQGNAIGANGIPSLYTRAGAVGTAWQRTLLPVDARTVSGGALTLVADPVSGQVTLIGGRSRIPQTGHGKTMIPGYYQPDLWVWQAGTASWQRIVLPTGPLTLAGTVRKLSDNGVAAGWIGPQGAPTSPGARGQAAVWQPDGTGGWTLTLLAPDPSGAEGINSAGTLIVGTSAGVAVYWTLQGAVWSAPIALPGGCTDGRAVDDLGRIGLNGCIGEPAGVLVPPYSASTLIQLGGLGHGNTASIESMSPSGNWIVGVAGAGQGVYWRVF